MLIAQKIKCGKGHNNCDCLIYLKHFNIKLLYLSIYNYFVDDNNQKWKRTEGEPSENINLNCNFESKKKKGVLDVEQCCVSSKWRSCFDIKKLKFPKVLQFSSFVQYYKVPFKTCCKKVALGEKFLI